MGPGVDQLIGTPIFGGYVATRKIGVGGMGVVYLLENVELGKKLAAKVLLPERLANEQMTARFLAEARAASAIQHRNIIEILDSATLPDGRHYILMEYLEGQTLRRFAKGRLPVPLDATLAVLTQVCAGLDAAHRRGIIHRDLKPSNIFVAPQPDNPYFTKILDFGIAKLEDPNLAGDFETRSQAVAGTPNYMSPEQARAMRDVDARADIYSVGVIAYELLTGRLPYYANSVGDLVYQQSQEPAPPPREYRESIPRAWNALIESALSFEADARPQSAMHFATMMVEATPNGDEVARAYAPLLCAGSTPPIVSSAPVIAMGWGDDASMPDGTADIAPQTSRTESLVQSVPPAGPVEVGETIAATPAALAATGPEDAAPQPTTLSMGASESKQIHIDVPNWRKRLIAGGAIVAVVAAIALFAFARAGGDDEQPRATPAAAPPAKSPPAGVDTAPEPAFEVEPMAVSDADEVDAGVAAPEQTDTVTAKPTKRTKRTKPKRTKPTKPEPDPPVSDDDLFESRK
jgi:serine/threonine-protein kinase